jgi:hypothetical protein
MSRRPAHAGKAVRNALRPYGQATGQGTAARAADGFGRPTVGDALVRAQDRHQPHRTVTDGEGLCP